MNIYLQKYKLWGLLPIVYFYINFWRLLFGRRKVMSGISGIQEAMVRDYKYKDKTE